MAHINLLSIIKEESYLKNKRTGEVSAKGVIFSKDDTLWAIRIIQSTQDEEIHQSNSLLRTYSPNSFGTAYISVAVSFQNIL